MGCAECHNHKFDPVLTKDFYALKAFFADVKEDGLVQDVGPTAFAPKMLVYGPGQKEAIDTLQAQIDAAKQDLQLKAKGLADEQRQWEKEELVRYMAGDLAWQFPIPMEATASKATLTIQKEPVIQDPRTLSTSVSMGVGMISVGGPIPITKPTTLRSSPEQGSGRASESKPDRTIALLAPTSRAVRSVSSSPKWMRRAAERNCRSHSRSATSHQSPAFQRWLRLMAIRKPAGRLAPSPRGPRTMLMLRFAEPVTTDATSKIVVHIHQDSDDRKATIGRFRIALAASSSTWPGTGGKGAIKNAIARADSCRSPGCARTTACCACARRPSSSAASAAA